ncbi:MAG: transposase [Actinomycetota bacterium]|nr:transposase [Actinomycetota bacterium]
MSIGVAVQVMLEGMPDSRDLRLVEVDGQVLVLVGQMVIAGWDAGDAPMRNLAVVTLRNLGFPGQRVAEVLGLSEEYVSTLRGRARREGSAGVLPRRGRPPALGARELRRARRLREQGHSDVEIGRRLGVHATTVGRTLGTRPADRVQGAPAAQTLPLGSDLPDADLPDVDLPDVDLPDVDFAQDPAPVVEEPTGGSEPDRHGEEDRRGEEDAGRVAGGEGGSARIGLASVDSRYAGAMLLHAFWHRVDAGGVLGEVCAGPARRRYDDLGLLTGTCLAFALGTSSVEGVKHLVRMQVGPLAGLAAVPELRTLRPRLAALADRCDPLELQQRLAAAMLSADAPGLGVYFVDDHFVPYEGAKPVGKGWNTKRRHAQRGRDDTLLTDYHGRAVCFASGEPTGLSTTLPGVLAQLRTILGPGAKIMLGFDRGGSYPRVFAACRDTGAHWLTWRRGAPAETTAEPVRSFRVDPAGTAQAITLADETVQITGYGSARQLTLFENDQPVMQILTSDTTAPAAALLAWLRCRWRIENVFKYLTAHHGIDWLCDYRADIGPDTTPVPNPARVAARKTLAAAEAELATAERALAQLLGSDQHHTTINQAVPAAETRIATARHAVATAKTERNTHPATPPANILDPDAKRARPHTGRRALQMVLRLLAYNAEYWLADRLNAYLQDPDEYRAITRNLLHLGGQLTYTTQTITVTLDPPATPRLFLFIYMLINEIYTTPPRLPADPRPITYQLANK